MKKRTEDKGGQKLSLAFRMAAPTLQSVTHCWYTDRINRAVPLGAMRYPTLHGGKGVGVPTTYDCDCRLQGIERVTLRDRWQDILNNNVDPRK